VQDKTGTYSVSLQSLIDEFGLQVLYAPENLAEILIFKDDVSRPGLQLTGFFEHFDAARLQFIGKIEHSFLEQYSPKERGEAFGKLLSRHIPALIISRNIQPFDECVEMARKYKVPLLRSQESTSQLMSAVISSLKISLAPRITRHGVLVEVYGEGILLLGAPGVGKSETAIELVKRGHRLIADDAVEIKKVSAKTLVGSAPELIRHYIEMRGIGIVDVRRIFGMGAVKESEKIDLVIEAERWEEDGRYDRLGLEEKTVCLLDIAVPSLLVPITPGRNLAVIIEVAAMNHRLGKMGHNAAREFADNIERNLIEEKAKREAQKSAL